MPDDLPAPLPRARERVIAELSEHFANDDLTLDDLERRIERVYKATTVAELDALTADLQALDRAPVPARRTSARATAVAPSSGVPTIPERARMLAVMSELRRKGRWEVPQRLEILTLMADARLDLTQAVLPPGIVDIHVNCVWAACRLIVPPGVRVINEMHAVMASVRSAGSDLPARASAADRTPTIRLTGIALMAEVKIVVRHRDDSIDDDDDD